VNGRPHTWHLDTFCRRMGVKFSPLFLLCSPTVNSLQETRQAGVPNVGERSQGAAVSGRVPN
jgi:hypothetical protein